MVALEQRPFLFPDFHCTRGKKMVHSSHMTFKKDSSKVPNNKGLLVGETLIGTSVMVEVA
jgi:hypothetical protein